MDEALSAKPGPGPVEENSASEQAFVAKPVPLSKNCVSEQVNYGSISEDRIGVCGGSSSEEAFLEVLDQWGGWRPLWRNASFEFVRVWAPLLVISIMNAKCGYFHMRCRLYPTWSTPRTLCDLTFPWACIFPVACKSSMMFLLTWRLVRQKFFYVLFRRKIIINLDCCSTYFARATLTFSAVSLGLAVAHLCVMVSYCYQFKHNSHDFMETLHVKGDAEANYGELLGDTSLVPYSFGYIIHNPSVLFAPECSQLRSMVFGCIVGYIVPGVLAIAFQLHIDEANNGLVPLPALLDVGPHYVHRYLGESLVVHEDVARAVLQERQEQISKQGLSDATETFRNEALSFDGVSIFDADVEGAAPSGCNKDCLPPLGFWDMMTTTWWPLEMILKEDYSEHNPRGFRTMWCVHCMVCFCFVSLDLSIWAKGARNFFLINIGKSDSPWYYLAAVAVYSYQFSLLVICLCSWTLKSLARSIYHLLRE